MSIRDSMIKAVRRVLTGEREGLRRSIRGENNLLQVGKARLTNVEVDIVGDDNRIVIPNGCTLINVKFRLRGRGHRIEFGPDCRVTRGGVFWFEDENGLLQVGRGTTMVEVHIAVTEPGSKVIIGEECMFANDIDIRTGDSHAILDAKTGERVNPARNVMIGDHVWIAAHAIILKGVMIGSDSIVAAGAVVTRSCGKGIIMAGNPAVIVKEGITWRRERNP